MRIRYWISDVCSSDLLSEILLIVDRGTNRAYFHRKLAQKRSDPAYRTTEAKTDTQCRSFNEGYSHDQTVIIQCVPEDLYQGALIRTHRPIGAVRVTGCAKAARRACSRRSSSDRR